MKCLVVGFGSIGRRHARVLAEMGHQVAIVTRGEATALPHYSELAEALGGFAPEYVVVANDTRLHGPTLELLAARGYRGRTLVEKPMLASPDEPVHMPDGPVFVGYTLRFHPLMMRLITLLSNAPLWTVTAYVGQYLPDWRPDRDYRDSYSARRGDGGVTRDLSHELDYVQLLAGRWIETVASGGRLSTLEINSEDAITALARCERCALVTVHLNYLDRTASRWLVANGPFGTVHADFVQGTLCVNGKEERVTVDRDAMIRAQHAAAIAGDDPRSCDTAAAMATLNWIEAIQRSLVERRWVDA